MGEDKDKTLTNYLHGQNLTWEKLWFYDQEVEAWSLDLEQIFC